MPSVTDRLLHRVARVSAAYPRTIVAGAIFSAAAAGWLTVATLEFRGSQEDIAQSSGVAEATRYAEHGREFPDGESIVVVVDGREPARARAFADALAERLSSRPGFRVLHRIDPSFAAGRALLYASPASLEALRDALGATRKLLSGVARRPGFVPMVEALAAALRGDSRVGQMGLDPARLGQASAWLAAVVDGAPVPSLAGTALPAGDPSAPRYLTSDNGRFLFLVVAPTTAEPAHVRFFDGAAADVALAREPVRAVRGAVADLAADFPGLDVGVTGPAAIEADERASTRRDVALAVILALLASVVLLIVSSRSVLRAAGRLLCLGVGLAWSFAFLTVAIGHVNMLSAVFASIVIGVGINFPIHMLARYEEAERDGLGRSQALDVMVVRTGATVAASAAVLIAAAVALTAADLPAVAELGVISAAGLALTLLAAVAVFPALVALIGPRTAGRTAVAATALRESLAARLGRARGLLVAGLVLAVAGVVAVAVRPPAFDSNLLALQPARSESVRYERLLAGEGGSVTQFVVTDAADVAEARRKTAALTARPLVARVESLAEAIPDAQDTKRPLLEQIRHLASGLEIRADREVPFALAPFERGVARLAATLGAVPAPALAPARDGLEALLAAIDRAGPAVAEARLAAAQTALVREAAQAVAFVRANADATPITAADLPAELRDELVGRTGRLLLRIYPVESIWERDAMARFLADVREVEPGITGARVVAYEVTEAIWRAYAESALLALALVVAAALAVYRRPADVLLALLPLAVGGAWTAGAMVLAGIDLNVANLFGVPLIIGVAVDGGMNMVGRAREEPHRAGAVLGLAVGKSVLLAALTTIAAFGALVFADHRGIASLGILLTLGATMTSLAAFVVLPPALGARARATGRRGPSEGRRAAT